MPSRPLAEKLNILGSSSHRDFDALDESIFQLRTGAPSAKRGLHSLPWQAGRQPIAGSRIGTRRRATVSAGSPAARARMLAQSRTRSRVGGVPSGANSLRRANGSHAGYSIFGIGVDRSHNCRADFPQAGVPGARSLRAGVKENPPSRLQESSHYSRKCLNSLQRCFDHRSLEPVADLQQRSECLSAGGSCSSQNRTSIYCLRPRRARTED
jgi:hypothetical protein